MRSGASRALRALPTLLRIGVAETVAYRAEFLVWILTTTQPLIMMALWTRVAHDNPFAGFSASGFTAYFLAVLIVRQLTGNWIAWQMAEEVRTGAMAMRLLRPIHPFFAYAASHVAAIPFRSLIALPLIVVFFVVSSEQLVSDPLQLAAVLPSIALAWLITFSILFAIGSLSFWITQTFAIANLYFGLFALFSGYIMPIEMLPHAVARISAYSPFRFMLSAPVELLTQQLDHAHVAWLLAGQLGWAAAGLVTALTLFNRGVRRFESVGG